jgi:hypothetical protein
MLALSFDHLRRGTVVGIEIQAFRTSELGNSAYLVVDQASGSAVIIDPVRDTASYLA